MESMHKSPRTSSQNSLRSRASPSDDALERTAIEALRRDGISVGSANVTSLIRTVLHCGTRVANAVRATSALVHQLQRSRLAIRLHALVNLMQSFGLDHARGMCIGMCVHPSAHHTCLRHKHCTAPITSQRCT
jgi:hypothetical protein